MSGRFVAPITVTPILWSKPIVTIENYASSKYRDQQDIVNWKISWRAGHRHISNVDEDMQMVKAPVE